MYNFKIFLHQMKHPYTQNHHQSISVKERVVVIAQECSHYLPISINYEELIGKGGALQGRALLTWSYK